MIHGTRDDLLWLAGLLEGEGSFDAHRGKYPRIRLAMTDRDVVGRAASLMDAKIRLSLHPLPAKATWHTEISGARAAEIMRLILPHMGARRSQKIAEVLGVIQFAPDAGKGACAPGPRVTRPAGIAKPETAQ
ncbi:HNH endonuclease [Arthrobacter phage Liebe]|uniref:LAGLIDADG endonuclease n=2 Tax=Arthrobacter virus Liebe TaxID=2734245 RepID=A0A3G2KHZ4_9CAUD|nr:HNH endonuclease [Arthrobacter phage Liebe]AYN58510.1 LAGLIDADG endonuclease [Arthrobacter phage Maureen]AZF93762.1 LAGIDADG endonuclease [Arthrobacter phage Liebe]